MPATGDRVPAGSYACLNCGHEYEHATDERQLPYCPSCTIWTLYRETKEE